MLALVPQDCLRALLAVLMNSTQNNATGCERLEAAGVFGAAMPLVAQLVQGGPHTRGACPFLGRGRRDCGPPNPPHSPR